MAKFTIYSKDGNLKRHEGEPKYNGSYMNVSYVEFGEIASPIPIPWQIGDYVDYYRTGKRYKLYSIPEPDKRASRAEYGGAFIYSNVQLHAATKDLEIALFRDIVPADNEIHFSTMPDVSTFENVYGIARRIQACMDDMFPGKWTIRVHSFDAETDSEIIGMISEARDFSVNDGSCMDALGQIYETWPNIGWVHTYDKSTGKDVITIGRANTRDAANTSTAFSYGKGKGLKSIRKAAANKDFATRLYVYGSDRNIRPRYYNSLDIKDKESVNITNLMLPIANWGKTDGKPDAKKAFLQADDSLIEKFGLIPRTVYFDGQGNNQEIFPSIEGVTFGQIRAAKHQNGEISYLPDAKLYPDDKRADEIIGVMNPSDDGIYTDGEGGSIDLKEVFYADIGQIGFDMMKQAALTSEGRAIVSVKSGKCAGRDFIVKECKYEASTDMWKLTLQRDQDESLGMRFPNSSYQLLPEDRFVLLEIAMPKLYVDMASIRLLEHGQKMLKDYSRVSAFYEPDADSIMIKKDGSILTEGIYMQVHDEDIVDTEDHTDYVLIDSISIDEDRPLPEYKITLREQKRAARTFSALEDMIKDAEYDTRNTFNKQKQYTERLFRSAKDTLAMLQGAFDHFSGSINPVTVETMGMLLGDESLQFRFTASRGSLTPIPSPLEYESATKQLTSQSCALIHMTLGIKTVTTPGAMKASDYNSWNVAAYHSEILEDADKKYYVYVKAEKTGTDAVFMLSETPIKMEEQEGYYHFLTGTLGAEYGGMREFVPLYGFTEILPGQITTDILRSTTGNLVIDLANAIITANKGARFIGNLTIGEDSSGLENLSEWKDKQAQIDNAQQKADEAQSAADAAQREADAAKDRLDSWAEDDVIAPVEKQGIKDEIARIDADKLHITAEFSKYKLGTPTAYNTAYSGYKERLSELSASQPETIAIPSDFTSRQKAYYDARTSSLNAISKAADDYAKTLVADSARDMQAKVDALQEQVDGVVESFSFPYTPTPQNYPASEWTTDEKKQAHVGDVFYNIQPYENEDGTANPDSGKAWRWSQNDAEHSGWHWHPIADSDAVRALQLAQMSVLDADVLFIQTSSQTAKPQLPTVNSAGVITNMNGWSTNAPAWKDGMYIWQSTYTRKGDGSASFSDPTCVSGKDGASVTITSQTVTYQVSASGTAVPTGTWSAAIPPVPQGQYLWTRTTVNYSDGKSTTSYAVARQGANGTPYANNLIRNSHFTIGTDGLAYWTAGTGTLKAQTDSIYGKCGVWTPTTNDRIFNNTQNVWVAGKTYTYSFRAKASVAGIKLKPSRSIADFGTAHSLTTAWVVYVGQIKATATSNGGTLSFSNEGLGTIYITDVKLEEGVNSNPQWSPYPNEMLGVTITSEEIRYAKGNYPSQPADSAFTLTSIGTLTKGQYLWTRTVVNYSDGKQTKSYTVAYIGTDGAAGNPGQPGSDGKTTYVHFAYASGITGSLPHPTAVTGFKTTAFAGAKYIGVCTDYNQADPTAHTPYEWSEYKGEDGVGIAGIVEQYYLSSSRTALQGGSWSDTRPAWKAGWYYWTRSKTTYTDDTVEYTAGICVTGDAGTSVLAQYSANGSSWHSTFQSGDIYMRTSSDNGSTWSPKMPLVGSNYTPNLLANSDFKSKGHWSFGANVAIDPTHKHEGRNSVKSAQSGLTGNGFRGISRYYSEDVKEGDVFTASIWVYAEDISTIDSSVNLEIWGYKDSSRVGTVAAVSIKPTKANEWQHFHVSHKMPATANRANLYAYVTKNGTVWFASPKLERGNNPSPVWSPAESEMKGTSYMPNLLLNSKEVDVTVSTNNYRYKVVSFESQPEFNVGDTFALSVENITVNQGTPDTFTVMLYQHDDNYPGGGFEIATIRHMTANDKTALFTVTKKPTKEVHLLLYAGKKGSTAGNAVTYENVMLVRGNNPAPWSPAASEMVGKDGQWRKFQWAKNTSTTTAPTSGWQDTPMTAAAGEYVWIRSGIVVPPATAPSSWDTATRLTGDRGAAGESVYMLDLSNEVSGIACDAAGNVTGSYPTSQASVWKGQSKVTSGITWSIAGKTGIDTANISTSGAVSMSGMTADQATITVQAVVTGVTLQSTISLYKVKPGSNYSENLVVKSDTEIQTSGYLMKRFSVTEDLVLGDLYTMTIWGELASGKVFNVYDNKGIQVVAQPQKKAEGLYTATFKWKRSANATDSSFEIYNFPSNVSGTSTIRKIKLEKGKNTSPVWSPAPNEMVGEPAVVYSILPSVDSISRKSDGTASVGSITCEKYLTTGNSARVLSTANYLYARQHNENAVGMWELIADNTKTSGTIAVSPALTAVVFELRSSSAASGYTVLDRERVPVLADGADIIKKITDAEYLQQVFPQEENATEISGGVVLTNILGVKNVDTEDVAAFINGGNLGRHNVHGKLLIAGGVPSTEDHPGINLGSRVPYAATRIYEDGTIDTSKLIARDGAKLGSFTLVKNWLSANNDESAYIGSGIRIKNDLMYIHYQNGISDTIKYEKVVSMKSSPDVDISIDFNGHSASVLSGICVNTQTLQGAIFHKQDIGFMAQMNATNSKDNIGFYADVSSGANNYAFYAFRGKFAGLRPNTRRIVSSTTLTLLDHTILIDIQRSITITLPTETDDAGKELIEDGQEYILMVSGGKNTGFSHTLKSPKNRIHWPESDLWNQNILNFPAKGLIYIIYCYKRWWGYRISNY